MYYVHLQYFYSKFRFCCAVVLLLGIPSSTANLVIQQSSRTAVYCTGHTRKKSTKKYLVPGIG